MILRQYLHTEPAIAARRVCRVHPARLCRSQVSVPRGPEPWFVLTGHTLMVGDMGL